MGKNLLPKATLFAVCLQLFLAGCMSTVKFGRIADTGALQTQLTQNVSTKGDVLKSLGPPRGYGMARLPSQFEPRTLWFYEYAETDGQNAHLKMLLVIFDGEKYSGHFWFSSVERVKLVQ
jgi:hypothetical protein